MRLRPWRARWTALAGAAGLVAAICGSCVDLDSLGNGAPDGGAEASSAEGGSDPCAHAQPSPAPEIDDSPGETLPPFEVVVDQVVLDPTRVAGYDLDGLCTCDERSVAVGKGGGSCSRGPGACDLDGGVDNAAGLVAQGASVLISIDKLPNRLIASGLRSLLVQLAKYNGKANDKEVVVGAILAEGIREPGCPSSTLDVDAGIYTPGRCGDDRWSTSPAAIVQTGSGSVPLVVGTGFVRDFHLVVRLGNPVTLPITQSSSLTFAGAVLTATIVPLGEDSKPRDPARQPTTRERRLFRLEDGVLAGRVGASELLHTLGTYESASGTLCKTPAFDLVRARICDALDVRRELTSAPDAAVACDALSTAFGFTAIPAVAAAIADAGSTDPCASADASAFACP